MSCARNRQALYCVIVRVFPFGSAGTGDPLTYLGQFLPLLGQRVHLFALGVRQLFHLFQLDADRHELQMIPIDMVLQRLNLLFT